LKAIDGLVDEVHSKELLAEYGIPVVPSQLAKSADAAVEQAEQLGYPVVLKVISPDISHKTDVGGVALNLADAASVRDRFVSMMQQVQSRAPNARIDGISVQKMISRTRGIELLLGMTRDPQFGPVLLVGAGGVTTELQKDNALELPPFDDRIFQRMLQSLRLFPLLEGFRGRPGIPLNQLRDVMARFAQLAGDFPELSAAEINPLLASADGMIALDVRMISTGS
jgi:acetyltransferase